MEQPQNYFWRAGSRFLIFTSFLFILEVSFPLSLAGQVGPANINNNIMTWLDLSDIDGDGNPANDPADGTLIQTIIDKSGNGNNAVRILGDGASFESDAGNLINGHPVLDFSDDIYNLPNVDIRAGTNEDVTVITVYRINASNDLQGLWGVDNGSWDRFYYGKWTGNNSLISLGPDAGSFTIITNGATPNETKLLTAVYDGAVSGSTNNGPVNGSTIYFNGVIHTQFTDKTHPTAAQPTLRIGYDGDGGNYQSLLLEMAVYSRALDACEIETINAYLANKYGENFSSTTGLYNWPAPHNNDIVGIGLPAGACTMAGGINSASSDIMTISNPGSNDVEGEFLTFAHDAGGTAASTEVPAPYDQRLIQEWRIDEDGNLGTVSVAFDLSGLSANLAKADNFALLVDQDGDFSNATAISTGRAINGNTVSFTDIDFNHGDYVSLAILNCGSLSFTATITDESCPDAADGQISFSSLSGATNFEFSVDNGNNWTTTNPVTGLADDIYTLVIRDADNTECESSTQSVMIDAGVDNTSPTALCQDISVQLDNSGNASITSAQINNSSTDACGIASLSLDKTSFSCPDIGTNTVTLTVTDNNNNTNQCNAVVTVNGPDNNCCIGPQAMCMPITVSFNGNSSLTVFPADIDDGSTLGCGLGSMTVSPNTFYCADYVGSNVTVTDVTVTLTIEDTNGANSSCNTTVSIINDDNPPVFDCPGNISVTSEPGLCTANVSFSVTATDNCSAVTIMQTEGLPSGSDFPVGVTTNTFAANDVDNNTSNCSFTVTVIDNEAPDAICQDQTIILGEQGPGSVSDASISGTINQYAQVTAIGTNNVTVNLAAGFSVGDKVLLIQMKGADIDLSNTAAFGDVTAINETGNYEYARIQSIIGTNITFLSDLTRSYNVTGAVQLVRVPEYNNVIISGDLTTADWNGTIGGVLAFDAEGTVTMNADIDMTGKGFRGGNPSSNYFNGCENYTNYFTASPSIRAGDKGEGISDQGSTYLAGRGKYANGGGGGGSVNSGGGGGSNYGAGGNGGREWVGCDLPLGGLSATSLSSFNINEKIFLGGGGGGGQQNNSGSTNGSDGGGVVLITADMIEGNNYQILANGNDVADAGNDGGGGGGAGGTVLLNVNTVNSTLNINLSGGKGGNVTATHGPGGGGGGGLFWHSGTSLPANVSLTLDGGQSGVAGSDPRGTAPGQVGGILADLEFPGVTTISAATIVLTDVDAGSTDNCNIASITLSQTEFGCEHLGANPVTLTVTDVNGLSSNCNAVITVLENTPPLIQCPGDIIAPTDIGTCEATSVNLGTASATDNCGTVSISDNAPATFPLGLTTVTYIADDGNGNTASCEQMVTVEDNETPSFSCPSDMDVNLNSACQLIIPDLLTSIIDETDNCSITLSQNPVTSTAITSADGMTHTVTISAVDGSGNINKFPCIVTLTSQDVTPPSISCPSPIEVNNTPGSCGAVVTFTSPIANDNCSGESFQQTNGRSSGSFFPIGQTTNTFEATDLAGNVTPCDFTVTVRAADIAITGNGIDISHQDDSPSNADGTDFGEVSFGSFTTQTFIIINRGDNTLYLNGSNPLSLSDYTVGFSIIAQPSDLELTPGESTNIIIAFQPNSFDPQTITLTLENDDCDESPYTFDIKGVANCPSITANLGEDASICAGETVELILSVAGGAAPYSAVLSDGSIHSFAFEGDHPITLSPTNDITYSITSLIDANNCPGTDLSGSASITLFTCELTNDDDNHPSIVDPCICKNNATNMGNGQFDELVEVLNAPSGQTWSVTAVNDFYNFSSPAPPNAPVPVSVGQNLTEVPTGTAGISNYELLGIHLDGIGYSITVSNGSTSLSISNTCYYPIPEIVNLPAIYCSKSGSLRLIGTANLGDGSGPALPHSEAWTIFNTATNTAVLGPRNGQNTILNPLLLGEGIFRVLYEFRAMGDNPDIQHPGCIQPISQNVNIKIQDCSQYGVDVRINQIQPVKNN